jgi:hypothetical protein
LLDVILLDEAEFLNLILLDKAELLDIALLDEAELLKVTLLDKAEFLDIALLDEAELLDIDVSCAKKSTLIPSKKLLFSELVLVDILLESIGTEELAVSINISNAENLSFWFFTSVLKSLKAALISFALISSLYLS